MFRYFLRGIKMIVAAAGVMPLFAKGRRKRPEETWLVLITDVPAIYYFTSSLLQTEQLETIYYHHICLCILPRLNPHSGSPEWLQSGRLVLGTTEGFPGLRAQGDSLMWLSWCCPLAGNSAEMPILSHSLAAGSEMECPKSNWCKWLKQKLNNLVSCFWILLLTHTLVVKKRTKVYSDSREENYSMCGHGDKGSVVNISEDCPPRFQRSICMFVLHAE